MLVGMRVISEAEYAEFREKFSALPLVNKEEAY